MQIFENYTIQDLAEISDDYCISIYLPSNKDRWIDPTQDKNRIKFKNILTAIADELKGKGVSDKKISEYLNPANELLEDDANWGFLMDGMILLMNPEKEIFIHKTVPVETEEMYYIGNEFYLQPLIGLMNINQPFYILSFGLKEIELYKADLFTIKKMEVGKFMPSTISEALGFDYEQKILQFRGGQESGGGGRAMYHGQKSGEEVKKEEVEKFARYINDGILEVLDHLGKKLIIASVDYLFAIYKKVNSYPDLMDENISLSPAKIQPDELKEKGINILKKNHQKEKKEKKEIFRESVDKTTVASTIVSAAYGGQIDTLFLSDNDMIWGTYDQDRAEAQIHSDHKKNDISLNNFSAIHTLLKNGNVYIMDKENLPDSKEPMNAILRYQI